MSRGGDRSDRLLETAERTIYLAAAVLLLLGAAALVAGLVWSLVSELGDGVEPAVKHALDTLLLVFIFVELVGAVRSTVREGRLVAEPFLLAGIIGAIKEIIVISGAEDVRSGDPERFRRGMIELGVLGGLILLLAFASLLLRRKEREPEET